MEENLSELRKKIDSADEMLIKGFTDRMKAAAAIGEYKKQNGLPVYDAVREENKPEAVAKTAAETAGEDMGAYTKELYSLLFELSREYQNSLIKPKSKLYDEIKNYLNVIAPEVSIASYISNIIAEHIELNIEEITRMYKDRFSPPKIQ